MEGRGSSECGMRNAEFGMRSWEWGIGNGNREPASLSELRRVEMDAKGCEFLGMREGLMGMG